MRTKLDAGTHPTFCAIQFLEDVYRSDPDRRRRGRLLGGIRCRWAEAHPEDAGIPYDARIISLVVNIAAIRY